MGLTINTNLTWKHHVDELTSKMNKVCYAVRSIKLFMSLDVLRSTYFSYAHSIISYGVVFWGNSCYSEVIFKIQKRIIRIIMNSSRNASCWQLFKDLNIVPLKSQYIYSILIFVIENKDQFLSNSQINTNNKRQASGLYVPTANFAIYQKASINQELSFTIIYQQPL